MLLGITDCENFLSVCHGSDALDDDRPLLLYLKKCELNLGLRDSDD